MAINPLYRARGHADKQYTLLGYSMTGVDECKWSTSTEREFHYGNSNRPVSHSVGKKEASGSLKIKAFDYQALVGALGTGLEELAPTNMIEIVEVAGVPKRRKITYKNIIFEKTDGGTSEGEKDEVISFSWKASEIDITEF